MIRNGGGKIDGIGMQGHYVFNSTPSADRLADIMQGFADLELDIAITELDIRMPFAAINDANIARQAQGYEDVITACRSTDRCVGVNLWDFTDKYSWVSAVLPGYGSASPWDNQMVLKEKVWEALMKGWGAEAGC
jgi:endo-1,4-beta-xylanase